MSTELNLEEIEARDWHWAFEDDAKALIAEVRKLREENRIAEKMVEVLQISRAKLGDRIRSLRDWQKRAIPELSTICAELTGQCLTPKGEDDLERITMLIDEALSELPKEPDGD